MTDPFSWLRKRLRLNGNGNGHEPSEERRVAEETLDLARSARHAREAVEQKVRARPDLARVLIGARDQAERSP